MPWNLHWVLFMVVKIYSDSWVNILAGFFMVAVPCRWTGAWWTRAALGGGWDLTKSDSVMKA